MAGISRKLSKLVLAIQILNIRENNKPFKTQPTELLDVTARHEEILNFLLLFSLHALVGLVRTMERVLHITRRTVMSAHAPRDTQGNIVKQVSNVLPNL